MASWMPGDDYFTNFRVGDPFTKVDDGYARLPGAGYEALHPELKGIRPEDYPDIYKMSILADIAPYSREYNTTRQRVLDRSRGNTALRIEYDKIVDRVRQTRDSGIRMDDRRFTAPVEEISGTVASSGPYGVELKEFPGRRFRFSTRSLHPAGSKTPRAHARRLAPRNQPLGSPGLLPRFSLPDSSISALCN
jgi:hypothetical protein